MDLYNVWLSMTLGSCNANGKIISDEGISPKELYENRHRWHEYECFNKKQLERALIFSLEQAETVAKIHSDLGICSVNYTDSDYPDCFRDIEEAPLVLFYRGDISLLDKPNRVSIIGSRKPERDGAKYCTDISSKLAQNGAVIVSGLAQGMDSLGHKAALANRAQTIAFVGTALDKAYPAAHRKLQEEICAKGCVVSEYHVGAPTPSRTFLERNRLIAACGEVLCVMQAGDKSGSLFTAKKAVEYGKDLLVVPGSVMNELYDGSNKLLQQGAYPLLTADDVLEKLGITGESEEKRAKLKLNLSPVEQKIYNAIGRKTASTNQILTETKIPIVQLKILLSKMEMDGVISSVSPGVYMIKS